MINNASILATLVLIGFVVVRAIALDRVIPWFGSRTKRPITLRDRV